MSRGRKSQNRARRIARSFYEPLETRTLLSVNFTAGPYTTPTDRPDINLGTLGGFSPIEPFLRINPTDPANIVPTSHTGNRISNNGGAAFNANVNFANPPGTDTFNGDTGMAFDAAGRCYWVNMAGTGTSGIAVSRINPTTGASITTVAISNAGDDKPFIAADQNPASPFANNVYVLWTRFSVNPPQVFFSRSTNQGQTFSAPVQLSVNSQDFVWPSSVGVAPNGDVYASWHANGTFNSTNGNSGRVIVRRSTDGGLTFAAPVQAFTAGQADVSSNRQDEAGAVPNTQFWMQGSAQPWILPDPSRAGNIYCVTNDDPNNNFGNGDDGDIVFSRSTDNGATWAVSTISSGPSNSLQCFPSASIDRFGNIVVAWYDTRRGLTNSNSRLLLDVMATYSTDGGLTWAPEFRLNDQAFDPDPGASIRFNGPPPTTRIGEYFGSDLFGGTAHLAWNGNTFSGGNPVGQQVVYSNFAIAGSVTISGDDAGTSDDSIVVRRIATNNAYIEVLVNSIRQYASLFEGLSTIAVNGVGGADRLIIDFSNGNPIPAGGLTFDGGGGGPDTLVLQGGSFTNEVYTATGADSGNIVFDAATTVNFLNLAPIDDVVPVINFTFNAPAGDDIINVADGLARTRISSGNAGFELIDLLNKSNVTINADGGNDTINLTPSAVVPITVNGGAQTTIDKLNIEGEGLDYTFNGTTFSALGKQNVTYADIETLGLANGIFTGVGAIAPNVEVQNLATLQGEPIIAGVLSALAGGKISPGVGGPGTIRSGGLQLFAGSTLLLDLNGLTPGTQHDQLIVAGAVSLGGATLDVNLGFGTVPGQDIVIIRNDLNDPVVGTFAQGSLATFGAIKFAIDYTFPADPDGFKNDVAMIRFGAALGPDPCNPGGQALFVSATTGNDIIRVIPATGNSRMQVLINGTSEGIFQPGNGNHGLIIVYGQDGNDTITIEMPSRDVLVYGNDGNDTIRTGNNNGILLGGDGNDLLVGGNQDDLLIGGIGADRLEAGNGKDILVAGSTTFEGNTPANQMALCNILKGANLFNPMNVFDDADVDILLGGNGQDRFFLNLTGGVALDISDRANNESVTDLV